MKNSASTMMKQILSGTGLATACLLGLAACSIKPATSGTGGSGGSGGSTGGTTSTTPTGGAGGGGSSPLNESACNSYDPNKAERPPMTFLTPEDPDAATKVGNMNQAEKIKMLSSDMNVDYGTPIPFRSYGVPTQNIPDYVMRDGPRGVREITGEIGTTFAVAHARAASFDLDMEYRVGKLMGQDMRAAKDDLALAPVVNLLRHPRWARAQEGYGEDPVLQGEMGAAFVQGMQKEGACGACPKHYVGNDTDNNRTNANPQFDEQTLRENYTKPFEIVVKKADPVCIMAAYNLVNDTHCTENKHLLTDILRTDWKFNGFVLTDWGAAVANRGAASINAGLDLEMPNPGAFSSLPGDIKSGDVSQNTLDMACRRVVNARIKMGDFKSDYLSQSKRTGNATRDENVKLAKETALKGAVLLKNNGILPIGAKAKDLGKGSPDAKVIAIVGPDNKLPVAPTSQQNGEIGFVSGLGDRGSSQTTPPHAIAYAQALKDKGMTVKQSDDASAAKDADIVIIPIVMANEDEGEAFGSGKDRENLNVSTVHPKHWTTKPVAFIKQVADINKNIVVLLNVGSAIVDNDLYENDSVKAVVQTFYPGQEGGAAVADLLVGDANFSGKLPFTVGKNEDDYGTFGNDVGKLNVPYLHGYRKFEKENKPVRYWFGYGSSYTTYKYSDLKVLCKSIPSNGQLIVEVKVENTGKIAGDEVVQLYIGYSKTSAPAPNGRPVKELKAFKRISLDAGKSGTVQLAVPAQDMAYWNMPSSAWKVESMEHEVFVGPSADPSSLLKDTFTIQ